MPALFVDLLLNWSAGTFYIQALATCPMTDFKTLVNKDSDLRDIVNEIEQYFSITLDKELIERIFRDAEENQVSEKQYLIFKAEKKILGGQMTILGTVEEYEPETIWIELKNIKEKDAKHFNELIFG